jgi:hypothetical protein
VAEGSVVHHEGDLLYDGVAIEICATSNCGQKRERDKRLFEGVPLGVTLRKRRWREGTQRLGVGEAHALCLCMEEPDLMFFILYVNPWLAIRDLRETRSGPSDIHIMICR